MKMQNVEKKKKSTLTNFINEMWKRFNEYL